MTEGDVMELHTRIEQRGDGFWVAAGLTRLDTQLLGPFPTCEEAKVQEIKARMDLRLRAARSARTA